ncbi:RICIN domain-containing protein [Nodularia sp. LEGE 04288]|uniref:RICIN domain-containing protein n=1 Tax=Nodularia sp. LEGE 04288 TaxID=1828639 RepID=UPI001D100900|nr:RICIN domain-containing protein [Nodularia sp. LEGE 04288]MCC2694865.1 ricin-type beta-trefoil lectin domain protein [Nodularia sp. LEGE 04288]
MATNNHQSTGLLTTFANAMKYQIQMHLKIMSNKNQKVDPAETAPLKTVQYQSQRSRTMTFNNVCKILGLTTVSFVVYFSPVSAQSAQTFSVADGMALNTNNNFRRIDGQPRMSIYRRNDNDPDQQFDILLPAVNGGIRLKHRSTGKCLNGHRTANGSEINVWNCDENDIDQRWKVIPIANGYNLIQRMGTNKCVDTPTRDNSGIVHLWDCDSNNPNQRWRSSAGQVSTPPSNGQVNLPFRNGQTWYVCQGYRGGASHYYESASYHNIYALDLTVENNSWGSKGCYSNDNVNKSAGHQILAPVAGNVEKVSWADDLVCLTNNSQSKSFLIGHMVPSSKVLGRVNQDAVLGVVRNYTTKNGYAHIHIAAYNGKGCTGVSIPFTDANGVRFNGVKNLPSLDTSTSKPMSQHRGTVLRR